MDFRFEGDSGRKLLLFNAVGAPHRLRATIYQGAYTRLIWQGLMSLNNACHRPARQIVPELPQTFEGADNTRENRRKLVLTPAGGARTVLLFDQPVPRQLLDALRASLGQAVKLPDPRVPSLVPPPADPFVAHQEWADRMNAAAKYGLPAPPEPIPQPITSTSTEGEPHEGNQRQRHDFPRHAKGQPRKGKRRGHRKSAKGKLQHDPLQRRQGEVR